MNERGLRSVFNQFIFDMDCDQFSSQQEVQNELLKILKLRYKNDAPRRPPRIVILGPPGSGRTSQCEAIANQFGLVNVSVRNLIRREMLDNKGNAGNLSKCIDNGEPINENILNNLVENRLKQSDCRVNGWVMEGFPETEGQMSLLKSMRIKPSVVFLFEQSEEESVRRLSNRRIDPETGVLYNLEINPPSDESIAARLIECQEDRYNVVKQKFTEWKKNVPKIEEAYKMYLSVVQSDKAMDQLTESLADIVQNPI